MMSQMQSNPDSTENDCYKRVEETNALVLTLFDFPAYVVGGFDVGTFFDEVKVMNISLMQELEACGYNDYLIMTDSMLNNIPNAASSFINMGTQIATGWTDEDTSAFISLNKFKDAWNAEEFDYEEAGQALQLFGGQLVKISIGEADIEVEPTR